MAKRQCGACGKMNRKEVKKIIGEEKFFFSMVPALVWQGLFLCFPLFFLIGLSFIRSWNLCGWLGGLTFENYRALWDNAHLRIISRSFFVAFFNTILCLIIAYPLAYFIVLRVRRWKNMFLFFLVLPFCTNFLVQVYAWYFVLEKNGLINRLFSFIGLGPFPSLLYNTGAVLLVMVYCYIPFMTLPIYASLDRIDKLFLEASSDLGATYWQTFFKIIVPLSLSGIRLGCFIVFISSFGEFSIPKLLGGDKQLFVGTLISYYFLQARNASYGAAFTCISSFFSLLSIYIWYKFIAYLFTRRHRSFEARNEQSE